MENLELQKQIIECGNKLVEEGLVARTWGNVSSRIDKDSFLITPSGRAYDQLKDGDCVAVAIQDLKTLSDGRPSSEKGMHAVVYAIRSDANFVIHTHQYFASALSVLKQEILGDKFYKAAYGENASKELNDNVAKVIKAHPECDCFLMSNHGALFIGSSYEDCYSKIMDYEMKCKDFYIQLLEKADLEYESPEELLDEDLDLSYFPIEPIIDDMAQFGGISIKHFESEERALDNLAEDSLDGCVGYVKDQGFVYVCPPSEEDDMNLVIAKHQAAWTLTTEYEYDPIPKESIVNDRNNYINSYSKLK